MEATNPAAGDGNLVLVVDALLPRPDRDSGSLRLTNIIGLLRDRGYRVCFIADDGDGFQQLPARLRELEVIREPPARWLRVNGTGLHAAILCRHQVALPWIPLLRKCAPQARLVFDTVDLHHVREEREAVQIGSRIRKLNARMTRRRERKAVLLADATWVVSEAEQRQLSRLAPGRRISVVSNSVHPIRTGPAFASRRDLVFVGGHRHPPNTDAVWWLVREVFPCIRERLPGVRLYLVGDDMPADLRTAATSSDGIEVAGHVADLTPYLDGCRVAIAPLRYGAGVKGKINMSLAHGQPVVSTGCGVEGMHLRDGIDVLVADTPMELADAVARLYRERDLWEAISNGGLANTRRHYSLEAVSRALDQDFPTLPHSAPATS
jgi:O-antigen biosynthesis protein